MVLNTFVPKDEGGLVSILREVRNKNRVGGVVRHITHIEKTHKTKYGIMTIANRRL